MKNNMKLCKTCKHWGHWVGEDTPAWGTCEYLDNTAPNGTVNFCVTCGVCSQDDDANLETCETFGCLVHESRDKERE